MRLPEHQSRERDHNHLQQRASRGRAAMSPSLTSLKRGSFTDTVEGVRTFCSAASIMSSMPATRQATKECCLAVHAGAGGLHPAYPAADPRAWSVGRAACASQHSWAAPRLASWALSSLAMGLELAVSSSHTSLLTCTNKRLRLMIGMTFNILALPVEMALPRSTFHRLSDRNVDANVKEGILPSMNTDSGTAACTSTLTDSKYGPISELRSADTADMISSGLLFQRCNVHWKDFTEPLGSRLV